MNSTGPKQLRGFLASSLSLAALVDAEYRESTRHGERYVTLEPPESARSPEERAADFAAAGARNQARLAAAEEKRRRRAEKRAREAPP